MKITACGNETVIVDELIVSDDAIQVMHALKSQPVLDEVEDLIIYLIHEENFDFELYKGGVRALADLRDLCKALIKSQKKGE